MTNPITALVENAAALELAALEFGRTFTESRGLSEAVGEKLTCGEAVAFADLLDAVGQGKLAAELLSAHYYDGDATPDEWEMHWTDQGPNTDDRWVRDERIDAIHSGYAFGEPEPVSYHPTDEVDDVAPYDDELERFEDDGGERYEDTSDPFADQEGEDSEEYEPNPDRDRAVDGDGNDDSGYHAGSLIRG
jgi:hypothetical protein